MDADVVRILDAFANDVAMLPEGSVPGTLVERTREAFSAALTAAAGRPVEERWIRFYREASRLVACLDDAAALPGLRAFLAENADLHDDAAALAPR
jgi:hypothetical protein